MRQRRTNKAPTGAAAETRSPADGCEAASKRVSREGAKLPCDLLCTMLGIIDRLTAKGTALGSLFMFWFGGGGVPGPQPHFASERASAGRMRLRART